MAYALALDQGTTSSRAIVFDRSGGIAATAQQEFRQIFPKPGWVEHDATEIWATQSGVMHEALAKAGIGARDVAAIGITNQRETTVLWERATGRPVANAIVWQDRRTAEMCDELCAALFLRQRRNCFGRVAGIQKPARVNVIDAAIDQHQIDMRRIDVRTDRDIDLVMKRRISAGYFAVDC